jgi:hypothetical protein
MVLIAHLHYETTSLLAVSEARRDVRRSTYGSCVNSRIPLRHKAASVPRHRSVVARSQAGRRFMYLV